MAKANKPKADGKDISREDGKPVKNRASGTAKSGAEDEEIFDEDELPVKKKKTGARSEEDDEDLEEVEDDWEKAEEEEDWDKDFEEFDIPRSKSKSGGGKKSFPDEDDDFKIDEEFNDLFGDEKDDFDDDDDDF